MCYMVKSSGDFNLNVVTKTLHKLLNTSLMCYQYLWCVGSRYAHRAQVFVLPELCLYPNIIYQEVQVVIIPINGKLVCVVVKYSRAVNLVYPNLANSHMPLMKALTSLRSSPELNKSKCYIHTQVNRLERQNQPHLLIGAHTTQINGE